MGYDVFTSIMCPVMTTVWDKSVEKHVPTPFTEIAKKHSKLLAESEEFPQGVCLSFLRDVADGRCIFEASKGNGLCWAAEGNGTNIDFVVDQLLPFFVDLWNMRAIFWTYGIIITTNGESEGETRVVQLRLPAHVQNMLRFNKQTVRTGDVGLSSFTEEWHVKFDKE